MIVNTFLISIFCCWDIYLSTTATSPSWLDSVLGQPKQGVFSASFEGVNNTVMEFDDGDNASIDCKVFLKQEKTVSALRQNL